MAITNKLKSLLDQPVWEWTRFNVTPGQTSGMTAHSGPDGRYLYSINGQTFSRFDTFTDTLQVLNTPPVTVTGLVDVTYKGYDGYYSRAIGGTATTINGSFIDGKICKGKKIRILEGTNDGQERTITDVSKPITVDTVVATSVNTSSPVSVSDSSKFWAINQWRGYQYRIISGNGKGVIKRIIYNNTNTLYFADSNYLGIEPRMSYAPFKSNPSSANDSTKSIGVIEYQTATIDTPFTSPPDATTKYIVLGGAVWLATASTSTPFYQYCVYDILSDEWYLKGAYSTFFLAQMGGTGTPANTISLERIGEYAGSYLSGGVVSSTLRSITDSSLALTPDRYANYQLRLDNGQTRVIKTNSADTFTFYRDMDFLPLSGTTFNIFADNDKLFMSGAGGGMLAQYSIQRDAWTQGEIHDSGNVRNISVGWGYESHLPISTITYTATAGAYGYPGATGYAEVTTVFNHSYKLGDIINIDGVTQTQYNMSNVPIYYTNGVTNLRYPLTATPSDTSISNTDGTNCVLPTTVVLPDSSKNWTVDEHRGKVLFVSNNSSAATTNARLVYVNTSTALSSAPFAAAHTIGAKYHLQDIKSFGADIGIGTNVAVISGTTTNGGNLLTNVTNITALRPNMPILTTSGRLSAQPYTRIIGINTTTNEVYFNQTFSGEQFIQLTADERLTNGWGVSNTICSFRPGDIPVHISSLINFTGLTVAATTAYPHGYTTGDLVSIRGVAFSSPNQADATFMVTYAPITVTSNTTFTYQIPVAPARTTAVVENSNSTTQLVDASKNWPTNLFSGARCRIVAGTGAGQEFTINTNTVNALQFTAITTAPDTTSVYVIYPNQPRGIGTVMRYVGNNSDPETKGKYLISVRGGNTSNIEKFNITTSEWEFVDAQPLSLVSDTLGPGTVGTYDGDDRFYLQKNVTHRFVYLDVNTNQVVPWGQAPNPTTPGTINNGNKCEVVTSEDGLKYLYFQKNDSGEMYRTLLFV